MKARLLNNLGLKILSLLLAIMLWVVVTTVEDPNKTRKIPSVKVEVLNEDVILKQDKVYEILSGSEVDIILEGRQSNVLAVDKADFKVTADLSELTPPYESVSIKVECPKYDYLPASQFSYHLGKANVMKITMEDKATQQFPVRVDAAGTPEDGYTLGETRVSTKIVKVSGAKSLVEKIDHVAATLDISGLSADTKFKEALVAYDEDGKALDSEKLTFSVDKVNITVKLLKTKSIPLYIRTKGNPADGYGVTESDYEPKEILVAGREEALNKIDSLTIPVDVSGLSTEWETEITITDYLPDTIRLADGNTTVMVEIMVEPFEKRDFLLSYINIAFKNTPEEYQLSYQNITNTNMNVQVMGKKDVVEALTIDELNAYVDLNGLEAGTHTLRVQFQLPDGLSIVTAPNITIELIERNVSQTGEPPEESSTPEPEPVMTAEPTASPTGAPEEETPEPTATEEPTEEP